MAGLIPFLMLAWTQLSEGHDVVRNATICPDPYDLTVPETSRLACWKKSKLTYDLKYATFGHSGHSDTTVDTTVITTHFN